MRVDALHASLPDEEFRLSNAILLYKDGKGQEIFASVHDVEVINGTPSIKEGTPVSKTGLVKALKALNPRGFQKPELLGEHVLAKGSDHLAWFCKPGKRDVWFRCEELGGEVSATVDHPGLVFIIVGDRWHVFAVKTTTRPTAETEIFVAPYFNVWSGGHICTGNIAIPKGKAARDTSAWENAFLDTYFTHPNIHEKGKLTKFRGGPFSLWRALMRGPQFPVRSLVPTGQTLGELFERMVDGPA